MAKKRAAKPKKKSSKTKRKKFDRPVAKVLTFDQFMKDLVLPAYGTIQCYSVNGSDTWCTGT